MSVLTASGMWNITLVLLYAALLVIITSVLSLRTNDPDPMLAGRNMPWWLVAGSIIGTDISSLAFLGYPEKGYNFDFHFLLGDTFGLLIAAPIGILFFIDFLRKTRNASIYTLLGDRFGKWASTYTSTAFIAYSCVRMGTITCLVAKALHLICGIDTFSVMVLTGAIVIFYTYMSGIEGVIWTDFFQTLILLAAGIAAILFLNQGFNAINPNWFCEILQSDILAEKKAFLTADPKLLMITLLFWSAMGIQGFFSNQAFAQRYIVARSSGHAKVGLAVGAVGAAAAVTLFVTIGFLLYFYKKTNPGDFALFEEGRAQIFSYFINNHFPDGLKGLAIIGILAAAMSTIDSGINSSSTVLICNLYEPYSKASVLRQSMLTSQILRKSSVIFGVAGIALAYYIYSSGVEIVGWFFKTIGLLHVSTFGLFLLMRCCPKAGRMSGIIGGTIGFAVAAWMTLTAGHTFWWASPFNHMLTLPVGISIVVVLGALVSKFAPHTPENLEKKPVLDPAAIANLAKKRKRTKKNIFSDSLRPKPFYRLYAGITVLALGFMVLQKESLGLVEMDINLLWVAIGSLCMVIAGPFIVRNAHSKWYTLFEIICLGIGLPFLASVLLFAHPSEAMYGYLYLIALGTLGTMVGWSILGAIGMLATAIGAQLSVNIYPVVGVPSEWAMVAIGGLAIFTYFAMEAAKEALVTERTLSKIHIIVQKIYQKIMQSSVEILQARRTMHLKDLDNLAKTAGDVERMILSLMGATDTHPEEDHLELSIRESLMHVKQKFSTKAQAALTLKGDDDFLIIGNRDAFETVLSHVLENAFYYVDRGLATQVVCTIDASQKNLTIANNGPQINAKDSLYIFDMGYVSNKDGLGLGLTYCKRMLESMRGGIRLISTPNQEWVKFRIYFPKYHQIQPEAPYVPLGD